MTSISATSVPLVAKPKEGGKSIPVVAVGLFTDTGEGGARGIVRYEDNVFGMGVVDGALCILNNEDFTFSVKSAAK